MKNETYILQNANMVLSKETAYKKHQHNAMLPSNIKHDYDILFDFSLTVKAATLIFISGRGSAISSAK